LIGFSAEEQRCQSTIQSGVKMLGRDQEKSM